MCSCICDKMARRITLQRIIISGLVVYIFLCIYFLLAITQDMKVDRYVDSVEISEKDIIVTQRDVNIERNVVKIGKYEINHQAIEKFTSNEVQERRTRKPTKPPRSKIHSRINHSESFRMPSAVNHNFSEIAPRVFVYSAFLDDRYSTTFIRLTVIAPRDRKKKPSGIHCVFPNGEMTELVYYETCENHLKPNSFYTMSCHVPESEVVSFEEITPLTISPTKESNPDQYKFISVINNIGINMASGRKEMRKFAVCVPALFGNINVLRLVEFIELSKLLGSAHFTFYTSGISDDILRVLTYYAARGSVTILPWNPPTEGVWYKGQSAAVGDCLLRNMHIHEIVAFNDIDEFIIPVNFDNWDGLLNSLREQVTANGKNADNIAVFRFKSAFFEQPQIQPNEELTKAERTDRNLMNKFVSLSHTHRTKIFSRIRTKMLVYPLRVFELGIHHLSKQLKEKYFGLDVEPETALLHHYRKCDSSYGMSCLRFLKYESALKFKLPLINHTISVLKDLKYSTNTTSKK